MMLSLLLATAQVNPSIASLEASYDGASLHLQGDVVLDHTFGTMRSENATLTKEIESNFPFSHVELKKEVHIDLSSKSAAVDCDEAELDFASFQGDLFSQTEVHYTDLSRDAPLEIFSPHVHLQMTPSYAVDKIDALTRVHLIYNHLYHLNTTSMLFSDSLVQGSNPCTWSFQNDEIKASSFTLDRISNTLHLRAAAGKLSSKEDTLFSAQDLYWKHTDNLLTLTGSPLIETPSLGKISSNQEISLILHNEEISQIISQGKTTLTSKEGNLLTTEGNLIVDCASHLAKVSSPLVYKEAEMTIEADSADLFYTEDAAGIHPSSVQLSNQVKIFSKDLQGIADTLTYDPQTRGCILKAKEGQRVLFSRDGDSPLRMSAKEIHITYDAETKEQQIRGIGQVSFTLSIDEQKFLNQVFGHVLPAP